MKFKFKEGTSIVTDDFWHDLIGGGGYIKPAEILEDEEQIKAVQEAMKLLQSLEEQLRDEELIEDM